MFAINHCTVTPVRQEPSEGSEQLTQLLFGEVCEVLDRLPRWTKIRSTLDEQEGWVDFKMLSPAPISSQEVKGERLKVKGEGVISVPMAIATDMETGEELMLTLGTRLPNYAHGTFEVLGKQYLIDPACVNEAIRRKVRRYAPLRKHCSTPPTSGAARMQWVWTALDLRKSYMRLKVSTFFAMPVSK